MSKKTIVDGNVFEFTGGNNITYGKKGIENSASKVSQKGTDKGVTHNPPNTYETIQNLKGVKVTAILFFDGTKNNRNNTFRRLDKDKKTKTSAESKTIYHKNYEEESSYENGYSNVAALAYMAIEDEKSKIVKEYIEGEGTDDNVKGDTQGYGFGSGDTGIPIKVKKGYAKINARINKVYIKNKEYVSELTFHVFGFSRGAAAARSFITTTRAQFKKTHPKAKITYAFVGLFDTVSSYEPEGNFGKYGSALSHDFENDVKELGLQLGGIPKKVVHLIAENEYRENFSLTTIASSIAAGVGFELQIPGAHSDVGGGYEEYEHFEQRQLHKAKRGKDLLRKEGWYTDIQIKHPGTIYCEGIRKLKNSYQFIPLLIMQHFAMKYGIKFISFDDRLEYKAFKVIPELENIKNKLLNLALQKEGAGKINAKLNDITELRHLRNRYLHISSNEYSLGMGENVPSIWSNEVKRNIIQDNVLV